MEENQEITTKETGSTNSIDKFSIFVYFVIFRYDWIWYNKISNRYIFLMENIEMDAYQIKGYRIVVETDNYDIATRIRNFADATIEDGDLENGTSCKCVVTLDKEFPIFSTPKQMVSPEKYRKLEGYFYGLRGLCDELNAYDDQEFGEYIVEATNWVRENAI